MEESKDLTKLQFDELVGSLMSHEERLNESFEAVEKAFSSRLQITKNEDASSSTTKSHQGQGKWKSQNYSRGRGRGGSSGRGSFRGRSRGRFDKRNVQCYHCNRYGHFERECRLKEGKMLIMLKKVVSILQINYFYLMPNMKILVKMFGI